LMFQPETGNLSLNLDITKNIFQALGGKFTIRRHPEQGEVVTIFLPMEAAEAS
ncbi:MAG: sensor histidine kinase, partial [Cyanobacteria bacterium P01_A01_bin.135]